LNAYLDASVLLRVVLRQPSPFDLDTVALGVSSSLVEVECLRTLDCARVQGDLSDKKVTAARAVLFDILEEVTMVELTKSVLRRAAQPLPTPLRTLDALHLATALIWRETHDQPLMMATHDVALGAAARAHSMPVVGI
jgi:predicted nucleic acid-binding protein